MANYSNLKAAIAAAIKTNGNQEITGQVLQDVLTSIVSVIGANYTFAGVATPSTNPGTPDQNVVYMASQAGTYTNFNNIELPDGISLLLWNGSWSRQTFFAVDDEPSNVSDKLVKSKGINSVYGSLSSQFFKDGADLRALKGLEIIDISIEGEIPSGVQHIYFTHFGYINNYYVIEFIKNNPTTIAAQYVLSRIDIPASDISSMEGIHTFTLNNYNSQGFDSKVTLNVTQLKKITEFISTDKLEIDIDKCYKYNVSNKVIFSEDSLEYAIKKIPKIYELELPLQVEAFNGLIISRIGTDSNNNAIIYLSRNYSIAGGDVVAQTVLPVSEINDGVGWLDLLPYNNSGVYGRILINKTELKTTTLQIFSGKQLILNTQHLYIDRNIGFQIGNTVRPFLFVDNTNTQDLERVGILDLKIFGVIPNGVNKLLLSFIGNNNNNGLTCYLMKNDGVTISAANVLATYATTGVDEKEGWNWITLAPHNNSGVKALIYVNFSELKRITQKRTNLLEINPMTCLNDNSLLLGKKAVTFGDSITWYDGNAYNWGKEDGIIAKGYQSYMRECGMVVDNQGSSGFTMPQILSNVRNYNSFSSMDIMIITSGANDTRKGVPVGVVVEVGSTYDETTFCGALQAAIDYALNINPKLKILLATPIQGWIYPDGYEPARETSGMVSVNYANAIKAVGEKYSLPVLDWYSKAGFNLFTRNIMMNDPEPPENEYYSLHPSRYGYKRMADILIPFLKQYS